MNKFFSCSKCDGKMERGQLNSDGIAQWKVYPAKFFSERHHVLAYRCLDCGFIELYTYDVDELSKIIKAEREEERSKLNKD